MQIVTGRHCALCYREGCGLLFQLLRPGTGKRRKSPSPTYDACSIICQDAIANLVSKGKTGKMPEGSKLTDMERQAIKDARQQFYEALCACGCEAAFDKKSAEQIDSVIEAVWAGVRASMQRQSATGAVPF